jgi:putative peptidoglycan lipid II flippase
LLRKQASSMQRSLALPGKENRVFRRIFHAAAGVAASGVIVKLFATLKEFVLAGIYGRSDAMDAFLIALLVPSLLVNLIAESMNQALIPTLIRVSIRDGQRKAQELLSNSTMWLLLLLAAAMLGMAELAPLVFPHLASNFSPSKLTLSIHLFDALLPIVLLAGVASNCTAVLNSVERFVIPALAPAIVPLGILVVTLLLHRQFGIWALAYATLLATALYAVCMTWMMSRNGYRFLPRWRRFTEDEREVVHQYGPILLSSIVASGGLLVDQSMAAMLPAGSVSALVYAGRFVSVIGAIFSSAISATLTPHFSVLVAKKDWKECHRELLHWSRLTAWITVPIALALMIGAPTLIRVALQHGAFGSHDTAAVAPVLILYAIQIPFFAVSRIPYRLILAMRRTDLIFYCGLINLVLDIVLNLVLMHWIGLPGIALATSLWTVATLAFLHFQAHRLLRCAGEAGHFA